MGKIGGFLEYFRELPADRGTAERIADWQEFHLHYAEEKLRQQGARCMECGTPFCHTGLTIAGAASGCPVYNLIPGMERSRLSRALAAGAGSACT